MMSEQDIRDRIRKLENAISLCKETLDEESKEKHKDIEIIHANMSLMSMHTTELRVLREVLHYKR